MEVSKPAICQRNASATQRSLLPLCTISLFMSEIDIAKYLLRKAFITPSALDPPYLKRPPPTLGKSVSVADEWICGLCNRQQNDPRVLACFHSFCLACLQEYHSRIFTTPHASYIGSSGNVSHVSGSSTGYESEVAADTQCLSCPTCGQLGRLPPGGVADLPPNYVLQHRILLASLNLDEVAFYCDLCSTDIPAVVRCSECLVNVCVSCLDIHSKQSRSALHTTQHLHSTSSNNVISAVSRQIMCSSHPDTELTLFCSDCQQVVCRNCCMMVHRGHVYDGVDRAARTYSMRMRQRLDRAKIVQKESKQTLDVLASMVQRIETRCAQVEAEVDEFIDGYMAALEEHRRQLRAAVAAARTTKLKVLEHQKKIIDNVTTRCQQPVVFAEDLLAEGSSAEVLMFAGALCERLESSEKPSTTTLPDVKALETISLLQEERAALVMNKQVYGVITTQRVSPLNSAIHPDSLVTLNNARQQQSCEVALVTRDGAGQPMCHGGDTISAQLTYRDLTRRCIPVFVRDCQDGTYLISFTPDAAGNMSLAISIRGVPVNGSPYSVCVRTLRPHHGTFHCCSFCSSSGKKIASCGCGGTMPGGYKGCGHGHVGHPGRRHWSCCGNILHNSECARPPPTFYHLTL